MVAPTWYAGNDIGTQVRAMMWPDEPSSCLAEGSALLRDCWLPSPSVSGASGCRSAEALATPPWLVRVRSGTRGSLPRCIARRTTVNGTSGRQLLFSRLSAASVLSWRRQCADMAVACPAVLERALPVLCASELLSGEPASVMERAHWRKLSAVLASSSCTSLSCASQILPTSATVSSLLSQ